ILTSMKSFILPGGHPVISNLHVARCICRRAERSCVRLKSQNNEVEPIIPKYLNGLSDYLFILARYAGHVMGVPEIPWKPRI
ncbi:MAG: ATP:cob(I)alamin adenosyltransferase, partial [Chitinophagaceae bacterium]